MVSLTHFRSVSELNGAIQAAQTNGLSAPVGIAGAQMDGHLQNDHVSSLENYKQQAKYKLPAQQTTSNANTQKNTQSISSDMTTMRMSSMRNHQDDGARDSVCDLKARSHPRNEHFEIRWTNLNYQVEAKWYRRGLSRILSSGAGNTSKTSIESDSNSDRTATTQSTSSTHDDPTRTKILDNLCGSVKSGQVTAILGPSGAGKTSLLGCLTGKNKSGVSGCVQVISSRSEPMSICTIPQKDFLLNQLTVRENLWFASRLKHPEMGFDHDSNIERVLELLKLESCIDTKISKISGGQHKRVSIAQELLSNPDILILDEPTSGLDSLTCYKTVMVLRDLARLSPNPMAILATIHQPQREVFDLFNHVYILATGGRCIYEGEPANSIKTINEFGAGLNFDAHQYNPASYLVEIASIEFGEKPVESLIEHQSREFHRRTHHQDQLEAGAAGPLGTGYFYDSSSGRLLSATPNLKKRQSPMVARFRSTLSNLTGGLSSASSHSDSSRSIGSPVSPQPGAEEQQKGGQNCLPGPMAFSNEAFNAGSLNELNITSSTTINNNNQSHQLASQPATINSSFNLNDHNKTRKQLSSSNPLGGGDLSDQVDVTTTAATNDIMLIQHIQQKHAHDPLENLAANGTPYEERLIMASNGQPIEEGEFYLDDRLQTHKHNHKGHFLRHCRLLTKRSWLCLCKDPMLTTLRFSAHIIVPLLITLVYGSRVGKPNACPIYETEMDLIDYAKNGPRRLLTLQSELRCTFENVGLFFLSIYAFTFSTMCLTSLSFPLNMHVLLKEVRNGWYSLPTYFIGKTLADFPLEFILPVVTLIITYPLTGQPDSYLEWRFVAATAVFVITSLIAQTQGLIFGALFMNAMQAAVFVAPVSTTPLILLSGFLIRISQMPSYLQTLSAFSYFRYAIESLTIIRYGFGQCPCDPALVTGKPVSPAGVPDQLRTMTNYWLSTFDSSSSSSNDATDSPFVSGLNDTSLISELAPTTTESPAGSAQQVDFFQDLTVLLARANSFGTEIKTCKDLKPYPMIDFTLRDEQLYNWAAALVITLIASKIVNYLVVKYSVKWRL